MATRETWRPLILEDLGTCYSVSNLGRIRGKNGIKQPILNRNGYLMVNLYRISVQKTRMYAVSTLVAHVFHGPRPEGMTIEHRDQNRANNRASNLCYLSNSDNVRRSYRLNPNRRRVVTPHFSPRAYEIINELWERGYSQVKIGLACGVHNTVVSKIVRGLTRPVGKRDITVNWALLSR